MKRQTFIVLYAGMCVTAAIFGAMDANAAVTPNQLLFTADAGGANPAAQTFTIKNPYEEVAAWHLGDANSMPVTMPAWLILSATSGSLDPNETPNSTQDITVSIDAAGLARGHYLCAFNVLITGTSTLSASVRIDLEVIGPRLTVSAKNVAFTAYELGPNPAAQPLNFVNSGGGVLNWSIDTSSLPAWLTLSPTSGSLDPNETASVILAVESTGLPVGAYSCQFVVDDTQAGLSETIGVSLNVIGPVLSVSNTSFVFSANGSGNPSDQTLTISNTGGGILNWAMDTAAKPGWLSISPVSGSLARNQSSAVTLSVNTAGLDPDVYRYDLPVYDTASPGSIRYVTIQLIFNYDWSMNPGTGTAYDPYQIWTPFELISIKNLNTQAKSFKLMADLDMSMLSAAQIGSISNFSGTFDGNHHTIRNLTSRALFSSIREKSVIRNLHLQNAVISGNGGLIGTNYGAVENCSFFGSVTGSNPYIGGLISENYGLVSYCRTDCVVRSSLSSCTGMGGLIGRNDSTRIWQCRAAGRVSGACSYMGGLIGLNIGGNLSGCRFSGEVNNISDENTSYTGGLVGRNSHQYYRSRPGIKVLNCSVQGTVSGRGYVGGLIGYHSGKRIRNCDGSCAVNGKDYTGGLVGYCEDGTVTCSRCSGSVVGQRYVGGLIGYSINGGVVESYTDNTVSGYSGVGGLTGYVDRGILTDCYSKASVSGSLPSVGGLAGSVINSTAVTNCYAAGSVGGTSTLKGGLIGGGVGKFASCFWDTAATGQFTGSGSGTPAGMTGLTTEEFGNAEIFAAEGWDFSSEDGNAANWQIGVGYPQFIHQPSAGSSLYSGGTGTIGDPYQIADIEDFSAFAVSEWDWSKCFVLTEDIDLNGRIFTASPIAPDVDPNNSGFQGVCFRGHFDGRGHTISNLWIEASAGDYVGLFGRVAAGTIKNLQIEKAVINGRFYVGAIAGSHADGVIENCQAAGQVHGTEFIGGLAGNNVGGLLVGSRSECAVSGSSSVGGLAGENACGTIRQCMAANIVNASGISDYVYAGGLTACNHSGRIESSFCTADVTADGNDLFVGGVAGVIFSGTVDSAYAEANVTAAAICSNYTGGLAGYMGRGFVNYCYSTATVEATGESGQIGGLIGEADHAKSFFKSSFWDIETSGLTYSSAGKPITSAMMKSSTVFQNACWSDRSWVIEDGIDNPRLIWQETSGSLIPNPLPFLAGAGTGSDPYRIYTAEEFAMLSWRADILDKHIRLMNDIDLANTPLFPIGDLGIFTATFDGGNHTLSNVTIRQPGSDCVGLFAKVGTGTISNGVYFASSIRNLNLVNVDIVGNDYVGGIAGLVYKGTVRLCSSGGSVEATGCYAGGLTGWMTLAYEQDPLTHQATLIGRMVKCYSDCDVTGTDFAGGLAGYVESTTLPPYSYITLSYASGSVHGTQFVGGLMGFNNQGEIMDCYAAGPVTGIEDAGGFAGVNISGYSSMISNCFWDRQASGRENGFGRGSTTGLTGKTTAEMMTAGTFMAAGWDFSAEEDDPADWMLLREGEDYPRLAWQRVFAGDIAGLYGVDLADLQEVSDNWLRDDCPADCEQADLDGSGRVDLADLSILAADWMK